MESSHPPRQPAHTPECASECLHALVEAGLAERLSIGGAFGLMHYFEYRTTHDVDAWWTVEATAADRLRVMATIAEALAPHGDVTRRSWGDVASVELRQGGHIVFSFQIAERSAQLEPAVREQQSGVLVDSLADLVASKMVALVERGAPRDFRDIHALCRAGLVSVEQCWELWRRRQAMAGSDTNPARARAAIETHLARIELHRPLQSIVDASARAEAAQVRAWFREEFLRDQA